MFKSIFHTYPTMLYLEKLYNAPRQSADLFDAENSPLMGNALTSDEIRRARVELTELGYIEQDRHGRLHLTLKGSEFVRSHRRTTITVKLSVAAIIISILALLKPPSFDIVAILYKLLQGMP